MSKLIWLDLETTGLDPQRDAILEVAAFESTTEDPFNVKEVYHTVLFHPGPSSAVNDFVVNMHKKNGLWDECAASRNTLNKAELELHAAVGPVWDADYDDAPILAGSTIHFDRAFLKRHMPSVEKLFHHRHYDVSSIKMFCRGLGMPKIEVQEAHRAREDVLESVRHTRLCAEWVKQSKA